MSGTSPVSTRCVATKTTHTGALGRRLSLRARRYRTRYFVEDRHASVREQVLDGGGDVVDLGEDGGLEGGFVGDVRVDGGDAADGGVERLEAVLTDPRRNLGAEAAG